MSRWLVSTAALIALATWSSVPAAAQPRGFNYDEAKVPKYELPDPLRTLRGAKVVDAHDWEKVRRPEILKLFADQVYGNSPEQPGAAMVDEEQYEALGGRAILLQRKLTCYRHRKGVGQPVLKMTMLIFLPARARGPVPTFLALNFRGNHTVHSDPRIAITAAWVRSDPKNGVTDHRANEKSRGTSSSRWAIEKILKRGYGVATIYYGDIIPDHKDGLKNGPHRHYLANGQTKPAADEWGAIAGWAWGLSRALDEFQASAYKHKHLKTDGPWVDPRRVIVMGHSRLGKTALWAGAVDPRFAMVISNNSGCGGAALSRRAFGETVKRINTSFPHWFCDNFKKYNDNEASCPVDQHMLIALIAPRPVYVASAQGDQWADPHGEFLSCLHADPVYRMLKTEGLPVKKHPPVNTPVMGRIGYHIRTGKHDVTDYDWEQYLKFADKHLRKKPQ